MTCYPQVLDHALRQWTRYVTIPCAVGLLSLSILVSISDNLNYPWTSTRLAPSFALAYGYPLYSLPLRLAICIGEGAATPQSRSCGSPSLGYDRLRTLLSHSVLAVHFRERSSYGCILSYYFGLFLHSCSDWPNVCAVLPTHGYITKQS
jgi:hypothetical protein